MIQFALNRWCHRRLKFSQEAEAAEVVLVSQVISKWLGVAGGVVLMSLGLCVQHLDEVHNLTRTSGGAGARVAGLPGISTVL